MRFLFVSGYRLLSLLPGFFTVPPNSAHNHNLKIKFLFIVLILLFLPPRASAQNYCPFESIKSICARIDYFRKAPMGQSVYAYYFTNTYSVPETTFQDLKMYNYKFGTKFYLFNYDSVANLLYILPPGSDSVKLAVDFNKNSGGQFESYLEGTPAMMQCTGKDSIVFWGRTRARVKYVLNGNKYEFVEGLAMYYHFTGNYTFSYDEPKLYAGIIDSLKFNEIIFRLDSTDAQHDRPIDAFPFAMNLWAYFSSKAHMDSLYVQAEVIRGDSCVMSQKFNFNRDYLISFINLSPGMINPGDIFRYRVVTSDTSIFRNYKTYPDSGFIDLTILPIISGIRDEAMQNEKSHLADPYPNPFNSSTRINYYIKNSSIVVIQMYDILGNLVKNLCNERKDEGDHSIELDSGSLTSGIYIVRLISDELNISKKIILLK